MQRISSPALRAVGLPRRLPSADQREAPAPRRRLPRIGALPAGIAATAVALACAGSALASSAGTAAALAHVIEHLSVKAGGRVRLRLTVPGTPKSCRVDARLVREGTKPVRLAVVAPIRRVLLFTWQVPQRTASGRWRVAVGCDGQLEIGAVLAVTGTRTGPARLAVRIHVSQSGAPLVDPTVAAAAPTPTLPIQPPPPPGPPPGVPSGGCTSTSATGDAPSVYNTTPQGPGPWQVPLDPCNTEGRVANYYENCAYWAAEKRPDVWVDAVWRYGYPIAPGGAWNIELDAVKAGFPVDHVPQAGDVAAWGPNARMGELWTASPGGHVAYVEQVNTDGTIVISQMGDGGAKATGGVTTVLAYDPQQTWFIHRRQPSP